LTPASHQFALVVESNDRLRVKLADALVSRGYVVHDAENAEAAAGLTLEVTFSVIVVGASQLAQSGAAVRALLRNEGVRRAVVFRDATLGGDVGGLAPGVVVEIGAKEDPAARLRMLVPLADATAALERKRKTDKHKT